MIKSNNPHMAAGELYGSEPLLRETIHFGDLVTSMLVLGQTETST